MLNKVADNLITFVAQLRRCEKVVKGGKNSSYSLLMIVGDGKGKWAVGFAKNKEVIICKQKAAKVAKNNLKRVNLKESRTIHHDVSASHGATTVHIRSAEKGTGIVAGGTMRLIFEALGIKDVVAKCVGSSCPHNLVLAVTKAFALLRTPKMVANMRGKNVDQILRDSRMLSGNTKRERLKTEYEQTESTDNVNESSTKEQY